MITFVQIFEVILLFWGIFDINLSDLCFRTSGAMLCFVAGL